MAGRKLSAKAEEEVVFMENLLLQCDHLLHKAEEYATARKGADDISTQIVRQLAQVRQNAMIRNLGPVADEAGRLSIQCGRGSQPMRSRVMREGIGGFKVMLERTMKATIEADQRQRHEEELKRQAEMEAARAAAARMAERALREAPAAPPSPPAASEPRKS